MRERGNEGDNERGEEVEREGGNKRVKGLMTVSNNAG